MKLTVYTATPGKDEEFERFIQDYDECEENQEMLKIFKVSNSQELWDKFKKVLDKYNTKQMIILKSTEDKFELVYDLTHKKVLNSTFSEDYLNLCDLLDEEHYEIVAFGYDLSKDLLDDTLYNFNKIFSKALQQIDKVYNIDDNYENSIYFSADSPNEIAKEQGYEEIEFKIDLFGTLSWEYINSIKDRNEYYSEPDVGYFNAKGDDPNLIEEDKDSNKSQFAIGPKMFLINLLYLFDPELIIDNVKETFEDYLNDEILTDENFPFDYEDIDPEEEAKAYWEDCREDDYDF